MNRRTAFETGSEYIVELCNRCLLIGELDHMFERKIKSVRIHDLVRDMAIKIARDVNFISLDERGTQELSAESRRVGIFDNGVIIKNVESTVAKKSKNESKLRTLWGMLIDQEVLLNKNLELRKLKRLRVLTAWFHLKNQEQIILKDWLYGITSLLNLVSLSLTNCIVEELPDSIGNLPNLQILILSHFEYLKMLPSTITKLDKLIVFRIIGCVSLTCMPEEIGRLSKLEQLDWRPYSESQKIASHISQLKNLGQLTVLRVEIENQNYLQELILNVLSELKHLLLVEISFFPYRYEGGDASVSKLNHLLSPLQCLEELQLTDYPGESTPVWLSPTSLPNLKFLCISQQFHKSSHLRYMSPEFWEGKWKIEGLCLKDLDELEEEWIKFLGVMPYLRMVRVSGCPRLKSFPLDVTGSDEIWRKEADNTPGGY